MSIFTPSVWFLKTNKPCSPRILYVDTLPANASYTYETDDLGTIPTAINNFLNENIPGIPALESIHWFSNYTLPILDVVTTVLRTEQEGGDTHLINMSNYQKFLDIVEKFKRLNLAYEYPLNVKGPGLLRTEGVEGITSRVMYTHVDESKIGYGSTIGYQNAYLELPFKYYRFYNSAMSAYDFVPSSDWRPAITIYDNMWGGKPNDFNPDISSTLAIIMTPSQVSYDGLIQGVNASNTKIVQIYTDGYNGKEGRFNVHISIEGGRTNVDAINGMYTTGWIDPLSGGGYSGASENNQPGVQPDGTNAGGDGTFTLQDDDVPESPLPPSTSSIIGSGSGTIYCDTGTNVKALMDYMWTQADSIWNNLKKIVANPIDSILGLHIMPVVPTIGTSTQVYLGNVGTTVNMTPVTNPYVRVRLGSLVINKYWGSALDYNPFTEFSIYLPYIGFRRLNTDELMNSTAELYYDIDVASGACVAHLKITRTDPLTKETHVVDAYSWAGNMAMQIPVTSNNYQGLYSSIVSTAITVGGAMATGAAGLSGGTMTMGEYATSVAQSLASSANHLMNGGSKIRVDKEGSFSGAHGYLASQYAFIERTTPRQSLAQTYKNTLGYPSNTSLVLGSCTGFTQIEAINLDNISATEAEKNEIETLLKGGVLF